MMVDLIDDKLSRAGGVYKYNMRHQTLLLVNSPDMRGGVLPKICMAGQTAKPCIFLNLPPVSRFWAFESLCPRTAMAMCLRIIQCPPWDFARRVGHIFVQPAWWENTKSTKNGRK